MMLHPVRPSLDSPPKTVLILIIQIKVNLLRGRRCLKEPAFVVKNINLTGPVKGPVK
jgi:hypothetical protein